MNTLLLIFLAPFLTSTAVGQVESVQIQSSFFETTALKFYCRYGSLLNEDVSRCTPKEVVQEQTVQEKVVEVVRNVFVPVAQAEQPSDSYLESMIRRIVLELLPAPQTIVVKGEKGDKGDPGVNGSNLLAFDGIQMPFWNGYGSGGSTGGGATVINNNVNVTSNTLTYSTTTGLLTSDVGGVIGTTTILTTSSSAPSWLLAGNAGTNSATDFLGTTDAQDLVFRTNNVEQFRITQTGRLLAPNATDSIFIDGGNETMTGTSNIGIGDGAVGSNTTGISNIALGQNALLFNTTGFSNMAIGQATLLMNNGNTNTAIGQGAGIVSTGNSNTFIGYGAGNTQSAGDNNIVIGQLANTGNGIGSNQLSIGNWIYGDNGNIGIGQSLPTERLDVIGNIQFSGALMPNNLAGTSGQVLLSQGAGLPPVWTSTSTLSGTTTNVVSFATTTGIFTSTVNGVVATTTIPSSSGAWLLTGNTGTNANINFLGTTDNVDLVFRTNNATTGRITNDGQSTAFGLNAGNNASRFHTFFVGSGAGDGTTNGDYSTFIGIDSGNGATNASYSNFFGENAGGSATNADNSNFFGSNAGSGATDAQNSNFFGPTAGQNATDAANSNFFGNSAGNGATFANDSNFFGLNTGNFATNAFFSNFFGQNAGSSATDASHSNFFGQNAGSGATNASESIFIGTNAGLGDTVNNTATGTSILIGQNTGTGGFSNSIALGEGAVNTAVNQFYIRDAITNFNLAGVNYDFPTVQGATGTVLTNDGAGNLSWGVAATTSTSTLVSADNGLTVNPANNVRLGGRLLQNTSIETNDGFGGFFFEVGPNAGESLFKVDTATNVATLGDADDWSGGTSIDVDVSNRLLRFVTADSGWIPQERMIIDGNGFVGISSPAPTERLDVSGNIRFSGALMPNNLAGATGTLLMSQGAGLAPVWVGTSTLGFCNPTGSGINNECQGNGALQLLTTGSNNSAFGDNALDALTTGSDNTAIGYNALSAVTTVSNNLAIGSNALALNTIGTPNLAIGRNALAANTDGNNNIAVGDAALASNVFGNQNIAIGRSALTNGGGDDNLAIGYNALTVSAGSSNLALGTNALAANTVGANNIAIGANTATAMTGGFSNIAIGGGALNAALASNANIAIGRFSLAANTAASNLALGVQALQANTTGTPNLAVGLSALFANTTGINNLAIGNNALDSATIANNNLAIGVSAMGNVTAGVAADNNLAIGRSALGAALTATADNNIAIGWGALDANTSAGNNLAIGVDALGANTSGTPNLAIGRNALAALTTGSNNLAIGDGALDVTATGNNNLAIGSNALGANNAAIANNLAIGSNALAANTTGTPNMAIGLNALAANTTGASNIAIGINALTAATIAVSNTAIGLNAMIGLAAGVAANNNVAIGSGALAGVLTSIADNNVAVGNGAMGAWLAGNNSVAIGMDAMSAGDSHSSVGIGASALQNNTGDNNVAIGRSALATNTSGTPNLAIGRNALAANTTGNNSIAIGDNALSLATVGGTNIAIGRNAGALIVGGTGNLIIGDNLNVSGAAVNNEMNIGGFLFGTGINTLTGRFGIGTSSPSETLQVQGNIRFSGALMPNNLAGATGTILLSQGNGLAPIWTATSSLNLSVSSSTIASNFGFIQNGNSFGTTATLGTNDAFDLQFETNNSVRMALTQAGRLTFTNVPGNVFLGGGNDTTTGVGNVGIGMLTLASNTTGQNNVANGYAALAANTTGYNNTANGGAALTSNTTGYNNTANGILAMQFNISGINNVANGASALRFNTGNNNVASGVQAGYNNTSGSDNVIMGMNSFMGNVTGSRNIAIGSSAMINNTSNNNTALGYEAGYSIASGSGNTFIGYNTNTASGTITNSTALGANVMLAQSNTLILGNNVNVGIGTTTPTERLDVSGNVRFSGALMPNNLAGATGTILLSQGNGLAPIWTATSSLNLSVSSSTIASNFGFIQNGNSFGATGVLGTNDAFGLTLETVNTPRITIDTLGGVSVAGETGGGGAYTMNVAANASSNALRVTGVGDTIFAQQGAGSDVFFIRTAGTNTYLTASAGNALILGVGGTTQNDFNINSLGDTSVRHRLYVADAFSGSATARIGQTIQSATNSGNQTGATTQLLIQPDDGGLDSTGTNIGLNVNMGNLSGGTNYAAVFQNGNVGINSTAPLFMLHVGSSAVVSGTTVARFENAGGTCDVTPNVAGGITCTSDQNLKKDIEAIDPIDSLQKLLTVEVKSYRMNADSSTSTKQTGFLAQQLETQFPGLVLTSVDGRKSVSYAGMTPILTQAIQTLYKFMTDIGVTIENGVAKVEEFVASKVKTDELCVGSVCVTESQFLQMVQNIPGYSNTTQAPSENTENNTGTLTDNTNPTTSEDTSVDETSEQGESEQAGQSETPVSDAGSDVNTQVETPENVVNNDEPVEVLPVVETVVVESVLSEEI